MLVRLRVTGLGDAAWAQIWGWQAAAVVLTVLLSSVGDLVRPRSLLTAQCLFPCPQPLCDFHGSVCLIFYLDILIISPAGICLSWCLELRAQLIADYSGTRPDLITTSGCSPICKYGAGVTWAYFSFSLFPFGCIPLS